MTACAANKLGKYFEVEKLIWEKGFQANRNLSQENMDAIAKEVGLDPAKIKSQGAQSIENFKRIIDEELKKADAAIASGMKAENYYQEAVLAKGKKAI